MINGEFLVDINPNIKLPEYKMVLCKLNEEPIMTIKNVKDLEYKGEFINIEELSFSIPFYRTDSDGTQIKNERYDAIKGDMLILVNDMKYFYIHYAKEKVDTSGAIYKEVQAYSREYELSQKVVSGYIGDSRKIYTPVGYKVLSRPEWMLNDRNILVDENDLEVGFLNYVERVTSWRVGYQNTNILNKFRALDFPKSNLLQAFQIVQQTFGCIFKYDTINKIIDIYEVDQLGSDQGLHISDKNFLKTIEKTIKSDEIKTRLHLFGNENISIQKLSLNGQDYIDNFDFYKNTDYMSQGLINALNNYDSFLLTKKGDFDTFLNELNSQKLELDIKNDELVALQTELVIIQSNLDVAIESRQSTRAIKTQETEKIAEIEAKFEEMISLQNAIKVTEGKIQSIASSTSMSARFTEAQIRELDSFIREDTFTDTNYTEENLDELLAEGKKVLNRISQPAIQFSVSVVDFLSMVECQHEWKKFVQGDKVRLYHKELNFDYLVRFVSYVHGDNGRLDMKFSNTNSIDDSNLYMRDLLNDLNTTSVNVDFNRFKWDKGEEASSLIAQYIDSALDLSKQQILKAEGLDPIIDDRGIWLTKINPDGTKDPKQMRLINNVLAITNDGWNTVSTAISGDGVHAETISGKLGQFAEVHANQIIVGAGGELIPKSLVAGFDEIENFINVVYQEDLQNLRDQMDGKVTSWFYNHTPALDNEPAILWLTDEERALHIGDTFYNIETGHSYRFMEENNVYEWIQIVDSDAAQALEIASKALDTADNKRRVFMIKPYPPYDSGDLWRDSTKTDIQVCINGKEKGELFSDNDWADATNINNHLQTQFNELTNSLDDLGLELDTAFNDNSLTNIEANNLKLALKNMTKESTDILNIADSMGIITELATYSSALTSLTNEINKWINKPDYPLYITTSQRTNIDTLFGNVENAKSILINKIMEIRQSLTVEYIDRQVSEFEDSITNLGNSITDLSSDLRLTRSESNTLKTSLESLKSESTDLIAIATGLSITTERTNYSTALTTLETFLNNNWLGKTYPLIITTAQRNIVNSYFKDVELKKSILINAMMAKRETNTKAEFKVTTDAISGRVSSVESSTSSLGTRMTSAESKITPSAITTTVQNNTTTLATKALVTQTSDSWTANFTNLKNLATGQQLAGGSTTINRNGIRVDHTGLGGQYSEMKASGFVRKWQYGEAKYLNDIYVRKFYEEGDLLGTEEPDPHRVYLPQSFRGRNNVEIYVVPLAYEYDIGRFNNDGTIRWLTIDLEVICRVADLNRLTGEESKDLNGDPPWVDIDVYLKNYWKHETDGTSRDYYGIDWLLIAIGS